MRRRKALQRFGLVATLASTGGCAAILGGGGQRSGDGDRKRSGTLENRNISVEKGEKGKLVVVVTVKNTGEKKASATLKTSVTIDDSLHEKRTKVTVPGSESKDISVVLPVDYSRYDNASRTSVDLDLK
ncbi:hypothetical protein [Haladaptatus halobius]|jgi:hypothetical protein|uniref:hypothetical protein n=1 Tax=Haladaptatus halobius TaxID=2884875 RepID=UPI001D0A9FDE|nr:hypothetical protein [Haladaptatus halobius]